MPRESFNSSASNSTATSSESKSNRKYWGDESNEDAIYSVYLKKITYSGHPSTAASRATAYFQQSPFTASHDSSFNTSHGASSSESSTASDLVDGFQRVFRRRSSFDKQLISRDSTGSHVILNGNSKRSNRSASVASPFYHLSRSSTASDILVKQKSDLGNIRMKHSSRCDDEIDSPVSSHLLRKSESQMLQWETRQIRILKAGTLSHIIQYILMATPRQLQLASSCNSPDESNSSHCQSIVMEEERNNVSHIIHIIFVSYRLFSPPDALFNEILEHFNAIKPQPPHLIKQFNFLLHYWLSNYPEDFATIVKDQSTTCSSRRASSSSGKSDSFNQVNGEASSLTSDESFSQLKSLPVSSDNSNDCKIRDTSCPSSAASSPSLFIRRRSKSKERRKKLESGVNKSINRSMSSDSRGLHVNNHKQCSNHRLLDVVLKLPDIDQSIHRKALSIFQEMKDTDCDLSSLLLTLPANGKFTNNQQTSNILDLEPRLIASQLTTVDLENFVTLKGYHLLEGTRSTITVQNTVKYFNLLSRQVVITILNSNNPDLVASHWIEIALHLRRMKNFNSLKAVISGLTNESIYRLKNIIWSKLNKSTTANFKMLSSIVDDVDNQSVLRQTQLEVTKSSDNSFGTIPYLGTFFTDLTVIDSRYTSTITSMTDEKLINLEKCSKQFEVITQVQLLQKNVKASLNAHLKAQLTYNHFTVNSNGKRPLVKLLAKVLREWFENDVKDIMSENDCYKLSLSLEPQTPRK